MSYYFTLYFCFSANVIEGQKKSNLFSYKTICFITKKCLVIKRSYQAHLNASYESLKISHIPLIIGNIPHQSKCLEITFAKKTTVIETVLQQEDHETI